MPKKTDQKLTVTHHFPEPGKEKKFNAVDWYAWIGPERCERLFDEAVKAAVGAVCLLLIATSPAWSQELTASWYNRASCAREGTGGPRILMANGKELDDEKLTAASWDHRFGTVLLVKNLLNGRTVKVTVTDRGPAKRLYRMGRIIDLSERAMRELDGVKRGIVPVEITVIGKGVTR